MIKRFLTKIFLFSLIILLVSGCKKEQPNLLSKIIKVDDFEFTTIKDELNGCYPYFVHDTILYQGSVEYRRQDTLKINFLPDDGCLYFFVNDTGKLILIGADDYNFLSSGTFKNENEIKFSYHVNYGDHGYGATYDVIGYKK